VKLFPTVKSAIKAAGGSCVPVQLAADLTRNSVQAVPINYKLKGAVIQGVPALTAPELVCSRAAYEPMLRNLIKASCPNVAFRSGTVTGFDAAGPAIRSVSYRVKSGETIALDAALLVDATGPSTAGQKWLKRSGFEPPRKHFYTRKCPRTRNCWTHSFAASITYLTTTFPTNEELRKIRIPHLSTSWHESGLNLYAAGADPHRGKQSIY
jgi:hypothetical protein